MTSPDERISFILFDPAGRFLTRSEHVVRKSQSSSPNCLAESTWLWATYKLWGGHLPKEPRTHTPGDFLPEVGMWQGNVRFPCQTAWLSPLPDPLQRVYDRSSDGIPPGVQEAPALTPLAISYQWLTTQDGEGSGQHDPPKAAQRDFPPIQVPPERPQGAARRQKVTRTTQEGFKAALCTLVTPHTTRTSQKHPKLTQSVPKASRDEPE